MFAINLDENKRILRATYEQFADEESVLVEELPEGDITNYLYEGGAYIYDPLPEPEPPQPQGEEVTADEMANAIIEGVNEVC